MNQDLKHLIRLQTVDNAIAEYQQLVEAFPRISKALDEKLRSATQAVETAKESLKVNQNTRKKLESEIGGLETKIAKYRDQMSAVKTNEEYRALQHEIEFTQKAIRKTEDDILGLMVEFDSLQTSLKTAETALREDQDKVQKERRSLEEHHQKEVSALESSMSERRELTRSLSDDLVTRYDRIRQARDGIAVAPARDYSCGVCQVRIRPQVFQEVRRNDQLIHCDGCSRILYDPTNMDHPFEVV